MSKPVLVFCEIDAKVGSYTPVQIDTWDSPMSETNADILSAANNEYLAKLAELQHTIQEKYNPQLVEEPKRLDADDYPEVVIDKAGRKLYYT